MQIKEIYITITPPRKINRKISKIRKTISKKHNIKYKNAPLHITLRATFLIDKKEYLKLKLDLKKIDYKKGINIEYKEYTFFRNRILVFIIKKNQRLLNLEKKIVKLVEKYRLKNLKKKRRSRYLDKKQKEYFNKYKDPYIFEYYIPHMTILYNCNKNIKNIRKTLENKKKEFRFYTKKISIIEKKENRFNKNKIDHKIKDRIKITK